MQEMINKSLEEQKKIQERVILNLKQQQEAEVSRLKEQLQDGNAMSRKLKISQEAAKFSDDGSLLFSYETYMALENDTTNITVNECNNKATLIRHMWYCLQS